MNFKELTKFINNIGKTYNIPCYDICIYYDHVNVFRSKRNTSSFSKKMKSIGRNLYFMQSGTKIMNCVALMRLVQGYKASLNDQVCQYLPNFPEGITIRTMITEYSRANDADEKVFNFFEALSFRGKLYLTLYRYSPWLYRRMVFLKKR